MIRSGVHGPTARTLALATAATLLVGACSSDPDPEAAREKMIASLADDLVGETGGALDDDVATCVAQALVDTVDEDDLERLVSDARQAADDPLRQQVIDLFAACDALDPLLRDADTGS